MDLPDDESPLEAPTDVAPEETPLRPPLEPPAEPTTDQSADAKPQSAPGSAAAEAPVENGGAGEIQSETVPWIEGREQAVDDAAVTMQRWIRWVVLSVFVVPTCLIVTLIAVAGGFPLWLYGRILVGLAILTAGLGYLAWRWPLLHHRYLSYRVDPGGLQIRHGVLWRKLISIPISRVQHVDVTQGPVQRHFDLATLTIHTAGTEGASIPLSGLRHDTALKLRDHLLPANRRGH
jgi:hypothetical protein